MAEAAAASAGDDTTTAALLERRRRVLPANLSISYSSRPLHIVRGAGCHLVDVAGRRYLDCVNNPCHVGHCHPRVVAAAQQQLAQLNTNTRYLYPQVRLGRSFWPRAAAGALPGADSTPSSEPEDAPGQGRPHRPGST